ncbi:MAG: peptide ABC transporter permease [Chloroflexi bacterium]|nr:MAG: peptide ABC transporter permease [Chloroflexota bacterium]
MSLQEQAKLGKGELIRGAQPADELEQDTSIERVDERGDAADERYYYASQWQLIRWRFMRHRLALVSLILLIILYLLATFAEFVTPYITTRRFDGYQSAPPTRIRLFSEQGLQRPFVYGLDRTLDQQTFRYRFTEDESEIYPIRFFVRGDEYRFWGLWRTNLHLFGTDQGAPPLLLFGADELGRDIFSRTIYGARVSLSIGLIGVLLSFILGVLLGGISGYFGGIADEIIQRTIDFLISIPQLPFWMALSAALPRDWPVIKTYFAITVILSVVGWTGLARVVRGKLLALREEDYALAAQAAGASQPRIIFRHLMPGFTSHLIVSLTLAVPGSILGETALSFLGLGMQPPAVSWGVLLQDSQDLIAVAHQPWRLIPALFVIGAVLLFNFVGDGLRDAADPYSTR